MCQLFNEDLRVTTDAAWLFALFNQDVVSCGLQDVATNNNGECRLNRFIPEDLIIIRFIGE